MLHVLQRHARVCWLLLFGIVTGSCACEVVGGLCVCACVLPPKDTHTPSAHTRALQYVQDALQYAPQSDDMLVTELLHFKILLMRGDAAAAVQVMQGMAVRQGCNMDMLKVCWVL